MFQETRVTTEDLVADATVLQSEISRVEREHRELKARLSELNSRLYLSPDEEIEKKKIQKLKLAKKDRLLVLQRMLAG